MDLSPEKGANSLDSIVVFPIDGFKKITVNPKNMYSRKETLGNSCSYYFFLYVTRIPVLHFSVAPPRPPSCVCAGFVFMTTPVIRRHCRAAGVNTAEVHYTDCCSCLLPGSRRCLQPGHFRSKCRLVRAFSLPYTYAGFECVTL